MLALNIKHLYVTCAYKQLYLNNSSFATQTTLFAVGYAGTSEVEIKNKKNIWKNGITAYVPPQNSTEYLYPACGSSCRSANDEPIESTRTGSG